MRIALLLGLTASATLAQAPRPGSTLWEYDRLRALGVTAWDARLQPGTARLLSALPLDYRLTFRSAMPRAALDGALWTGKGASGAVAGGIALAAGPLSVTVAPTVWFAQNADFEPAPTVPAARSDYAYPWTFRIDWPQRPGPDPVTRVHPGHSEARLSAGGATVGFGWTSMWWGPAVRNPIIMGSSAPGFAHLDVGTARPINVGVGRLDGRILWGSLEESEWFDTRTDNDRRYIVAATVEYQPPLEGLTLGMNRVFYKTWDTLNFGDVVAPFQALWKDAFGSTTDPNSNDDRDQLLSLTAHWILRESRAAAWVEWGRNDYNLNLRDFLLEPDHTRAWTLGFEKVFGSPDRPVHLLTEFTQLGRSATFQDRATPTWYTHGAARQGYTNQGQLLAAPIGPGSESQHLQVQRYFPDGRWGLSLTRIVFNNDDYYRRFARTRSHEVDVTGAAHYLRWIGPLMVGLTVDLTRTFNRWYITRNDMTGVNLVLDGRWSW